MRKFILLFFTFFSLSFLYASNTSSKGFIISFEKQQEYYIAFVDKDGNNINQSTPQYFPPSLNVSAENPPTLELGVKYCLPSSCTLRLMFTAQPEGTENAHGQGYMLLREEKEDETHKIEGINYRVQAAKQNSEYPIALNDGHLIDPPENFRASKWPIDNRVMTLYNTWGGQTSDYQPEVEQIDKLKLTILPFASAEGSSELTYTSGVFYGYAYLILQMK